MGKPKGESRGLAFLQKARPEAVRHLLKFFAESARHLDPRTRFLISIVTKVINFSPRGLEQYVKRALDEGATPDEVIDAILCAYPCAGLTRVVDAIDVVLDLGLPGFEAAAGGETRSTGGSTANPEQNPGRRGNPDPGHVEVSEDDIRTASEGWVEVGTLADLADGGRLRVLAGKRDIAVFNVDGAVHACSNRCPHAGGPLSAGVLTGTVVTCPLHLWRFDVSTGACLDHPEKPVEAYEVKVGAGEKVLLRLASLS